MDELRVYELAPTVEETRTASAFGGLASGQAVRLRQGWVEIYTFPTARHASSVVASISADGSGGPFGGASYAQVEWMGVPHMFHRDRVIAIFLTEPWRSDTPSQGVEVLGTLQTLMGSQFAGGE